MEGMSQRTGDDLSAKYDLYGNMLFKCAAFLAVMAVIVLGATLVTA